MTMTQPQTPVGAGRAGSDPAWLPWVGMVITVVLAVVSAIWEAFLTPLSVHWTSGGHAHYVRLPVALVLAFAGNFALAWLTQLFTGKVLAVLAPFVAWAAVILVAASKTREGDLVLTSNNWVALAIILVGPLGFAVGAFWLAIRSTRRSA